MELIDRIRSQANNPAAIATENDPIINEYDGNMEVEGLGTITDLRDQYDLGPVGDNEDDPNAPDSLVIQDMRDDPNSLLHVLNPDEENQETPDDEKPRYTDMRDDPNYDLGPEPIASMGTLYEPTDEVIDTDTEPEDEDNNGGTNESDPTSEGDSDPTGSPVEDTVHEIPTKEDLVENNTRDELTKIADDLGIEGVASMPNKDAIADAIIEAESEDDEV